MAPDRVIVVDDGAKAGCAGLDGVVWLQGIKPFVFARNVNLAVQWAGTDVVLLNDDAVLETLRGFSALAEEARRSPSLGILSAAVRGGVGNPNQLWKGDGATRPEARRLSFVCVYIKAQAFAAVGLLDERYTGYGYEDDDFCLRILRVGMGLGVFDGCLVDHSRPEASTFRTRPDLLRLSEENRATFERQWGAP